LTKLADLFQSKAQTRLIEYMLENRSKVFNQSTLARFLDCSPSTIARIIEPLVKENIVVYERFNQGMKVLCLNLEEGKTKLLLEFHEKLKSL
jgi:DNA-binding MarR family transcriptional regulator